MIHDSIYLFDMTDIYKMTLALTRTKFIIIDKDDQADNIDFVKWGS